jgi:hypothetical protein
VYTTGAIAMGVPGCPELACCTASMLSVRMVFTQSWSSCLVSKDFSPKAITRHERLSHPKNQQENS